MLKRHSNFNSSTRRQGQALLISVIVMLVVVLLGAAFIAIVSSNMHNTVSVEAKDQAVHAAQQGIKCADDKLTNSPDGLNWRPALNSFLTPSANSLPQPPTSPSYYTSYEKAQGWGSRPYPLYKGVPNKAFFVKYPHPNSFKDSTNGSHFMLSVSIVQSGDADNSDYSKTGDIRIESIGFANDDPAAFYAIVAYKRGWQTPLVESMRSVSNWDWLDNTIPQATIDASGSSTSTALYLSTVQGKLAKGDYITVWDKANNLIGNGQISQPVIAGNPITLSSSLGFTPSAGSIVQKAAALGAPPTIDFDNATPTAVEYRISSATNPFGTSNNTAGSVRVNGGLVWFGQTNADNLVSPRAATNSKPLGIIRVSGLFSSSPGSTTYVTGSGVASPTALPTSSVDPNYNANTNTAVKEGLIDDGYNRLRGLIFSTERKEEPFTPPDITGGGIGGDRYRQLTKYSPPANSGDPATASQYGYGEGIYINNAQDIEKVGTIPMTQDQLRDLWFGTGATNSYNRLGTPDSPTGIPTDTPSPANSLEEQHLRGWVSPDQFLPRGAEVILNNTSPATITITLDARADNDTDNTNGYENLYSTSAHLLDDKAWKDTNGGIEQGVYSKTFYWPQDGTLFAEGNIRIRGVVSDAPRSLTVVSMNNIYIEGSLKLNSNKKVLLLAKRNVVVNPSQVLDGTETVSTLSGPVNGGNDITVSDASNFRVGDYITINGTLNRNVISISGNVLKLDGNALGAYAAGDIVHTVFDPTLSGTALPSTVATRIANFTQGVERRLHVNPGDPTNIRLAFRHSAEYKKALTVQIPDSLKGKDQPSGALIVSAELSNKAMGNSDSPAITSDKKYLQIDYTETPIAADGTHLPDKTDADTFPDNLAASPYQTNIGDSTDATAADNISLADLYKQMLDKYTDPHWDYGNVTGIPPTAATIIGTKIQNNIEYTGPLTTTHGNRWVDIDNIDDTGNPNLYHDDNSSHPRSYFLASVGNRKDFNTPSVGAFSTVKQTVYPTPAESFIIPMATSVWLRLDGQQATLQGNQWDAALGGFSKVLQFGFAPLFVNKDNGGNPIVTGAAQVYADMEDTLTSDQYFYQPYGKEAINADGYGSDTNYTLQKKYDSDAKYTLDSRLITDPVVTPGTSKPLVLQLDNMEIGGHPLDYYFNNQYQIPFYRFSNLKLQNETLDPSSHELTQIGTGTTLDINAYVYAQEGSWCVIPGTDFDKDVKNNDDLNRDGVISPGESVAAYRYHRYNYQIVFTGAIMENQTSEVSEVGAWTDKWATAKMNVPSVTQAYNSNDPANSNLNTILYYYDPTAALGMPYSDNGFQVPITLGVDIEYQG